MLVTPTQGLMVCLVCHGQGLGDPPKLIDTGAVSNEDEPLYICGRCAKSVAYTAGLLAEDSVEELQELRGLLEAAQKEAEARTAQATRLLGEVASRDEKIARQATELERLRERDRSRRHDVAVAVASLADAAREE
jgi:hypothetical protein